jgi:hypothetical protein
MTWGAGALHPASVGPIYRSMITRAFDAGALDALRWKSPRMPLAYNRNLAAEAGAAGRLMAKIG